MPKPTFHPKCRPARSALGLNVCGPRRYGGCGLVVGHSGIHSNHIAVPALGHPLRARIWQLRDSGKWHEANGEPGLAFIGSLIIDDDDPIENPAEPQAIIWVAACKCTDAKCPRWKALTYAREKLGLESITVHERARAR